MAFLKLVSEPRRDKSLEEKLWNLPLFEMIGALNAIEEFDEDVMRAVWRGKDHAQIEEWRVRLENRRLKRRQFLEYRLFASGVNRARADSHFFGERDV